MGDAGKRILLVIDDESAVCRVMRRLLGRRFDEIVTAETPADAEVVLASRPVTHVLCDHCLGPGRPQGLDLAKGWKAAHPTIRKIIILTGADIERLTAPPGIDLVLPKTTEPDDLAALLLA